MRVVYYTFPSFLDTALPRIRSLSARVELHVVLELAPEYWSSGLFDVQLQGLPEGILTADEFLRDHFPPGIQQYWDGAESFWMMVYGHSRTTDPRTWLRARALGNFLRQLQPDVIHLDTMSLRLAPMLGLLKRTPLIMTMHDDRPHLGEGDWRVDLTRWLMFKHVRHFILQSRYTRESFIQTHHLKPDRVSMVPLGVLDIFREWMEGSIEEEERTVLFFGRIAPYKGLEVFIDAAVRVAGRLSGCKFVIAGRPIAGFDVPPIPELHNNCTFTVVDRYLTNKEVASLMQKASIVVCPYVEASQSGVVLTAYAFERPVIVTNVGGMEDYVWDGVTGRVVPPRDSLALGDAIVDMLHDSRKRKVMQENIRIKRRNGLSWDSGAKKIVSIYQAVTGGDCSDPPRQHSRGSLGNKQW